MGVAALLGTPSLARASTTTATLVDGVLRVDVRGASKDVAVRARAQGCAPLCVQVADSASPAAAPPDGCAAGEGAGLSLSCPDARVRRTEVFTDGTAPVTLVFTPGPRHPDYGCATGEVAVLQGGGDGATAADDGCPQRIDCADAYHGRVEADASDTVGDRCRWLVRDGVPVRNVPREQPRPQPVRGEDGPPAAAAAALRDVRVTLPARRRVGVAVRTRRATDLRVQLQRLVGGRWTRVRALSVRLARPGTTKRTLSTGGRSGTFRVVVTNAAADRPLVSSPLRVR